MGISTARQVQAAACAVCVLLLGGSLRAQAKSAPPAKAAPAVPAPHAAGPTDEEVAIAVADLAKAEASADAAERAATVARNAGVSSPKVVKELAKFLKDKDSAVRLAAIDALGRTAHADALKELHRLLQSDARLREDVTLHVALLKAIGRHADPESVKVLADGAWKVKDAAVAQARLYALGNIRTKAAVAQIMDLMNTDPTTPWEASPYMEHFRVALAALSGTDLRDDKDAWRTWWREAEKSLKVGKEAKLPGDLQSRWDAFWKLPPAEPPVPPTEKPAEKPADKPADKPAK